MKIRKEILLLHFVKISHPIIKAVKLIWQKRLKILNKTKFL